MTKFILYILILTFPSCLSAQHKFEIRDGSKSYNVKIEVEKCDETNCEGKGKIELIDKKSSSVFQIFKSENLYFDIDKNKKLTVNVIKMYDEQSAIIFDDFNFDKQEDIAIRNGNLGSYGGPSYDVYVFNSTKQKFVESAELTELASNFLGMFITDHVRERLICFDKSGCCWHLKTEYEVVFRKGLRKVLEIEEDATGGEYVKVTTRELKNNKWINKVKKHKISEYYKE